MKRKRTPNKPYRGYMIFPLIGAKTQGEFNDSCQFFGSFANPFARARIFSKKRKYRIQIWTRVKTGFEVSELTLPVDGVDKEQLSKIMYEYAIEEVKDIQKTDEADINNSFFKIII